MAAAGAGDRVPHGRTRPCAGPPQRGARGRSAPMTAAAMSTATFRARRLCRGRSCRPPTATSGASTATPEAVASGRAADQALPRPADGDRGPFPGAMDRPALAGARHHQGRRHRASTSACPRRQLDDPERGLLLPRMTGRSMTCAMEGSGPDRPPTSSNGADRGRSSADIIWRYGEERRRAPRAVGARRSCAGGPFSPHGQASPRRCAAPYPARTTASIRDPHLPGAAHFHQRRDGRALTAGLAAAERLLAPGGAASRSCVVSIRSRTARSRPSSRGAAGPDRRVAPRADERASRPPPSRPPSRKAIRPTCRRGARPIRAQRRAPRKLRWAQRTEADPGGRGTGGPVMMRPSNRTVDRASPAASASGVYQLKHRVQALEDDLFPPQPRDRAGAGRDPTCCAPSGAYINQPAAP